MSVEKNDTGSIGRGGSQTVDRALHLVDVLAAHSEALRLTDLAEKAGYNISTTSRLLDSLERKGYVRRDEATSRYRLGYKFLHFANMVRQQSNFDEIASGALERLAQETDETATLSILVGRQAMVAVRVVAPTVQRNYLAVGMMQDLHCTAAGKAILAHLSNEDRARIIMDPSSQFTQETIIDRQALEQELSTIRDCGFALSFGEWDRDLAGIAAPVIHQTGGAIASCGVIGSLTRMRERELQELVPPIISAAREITENIGGVPARTEPNYRPIQGNDPRWSTNSDTRSE